MRTTFVPVLFAAIALAAPQTAPIPTPNSTCISTCVNQAAQQNPAQFATCQQAFDQGDAYVLHSLIPFTSNLMDAHRAATIACVCALPQARSAITTCFTQQTGCSDQVEVFDDLCGAFSSDRARGG